MGEAANGLVTGKCLGNGPDIAEAQIEQLLQGLHENLPSVVPSSAAKASRQFETQSTKLLDAAGCAHPANGRSTKYAKASVGACALERNASERVRISVGKNGTTTSMPQELLFELNGARVTPHIATFGGTSYQIATIGSVHVVRRKKYNPLAIIIFLLGVGILAAAIVKSRMTGLAEEYFSMAATGLAVMVAAFLLQLIWPGRVCVLVLRTSSGDVDAVISRNKEFVSNQKAIEQAFVVRARQPLSPEVSQQMGEKIQ